MRYVSITMNDLTAATELKLKSGQSQGAKLASIGQEQMLHDCFIKLLSLDR